MTSKNVGASLIALSAAICSIAYAQPRRDPEPHAVDNHDQLLADPELKLTQLHPNAAAYIVTSSDGQSFTDAELQDGDNSPWRLKAEFDCSDGGVWENVYGINYFNSPGTLEELTLFGIGFPDLLSWDAGYELKDANSGAVETSMWANDYAQDHWVDNGQQAAIDACNDAANVIRSQNPGMSAKVAMSRVGTINPLGESDIAGVIARPKIRARCIVGVYEDNPSGPGYVWVEGYAAEDETPELKLKLPVVCKSPLKPVRPASDSIAAAFGVTELTLTPQPVLASGQCPRTVKFNASVSASGSGQVKYRIRGSDGSLSPVRTVNVNSSEPAKFSFERTFGETTSGGLVTPTDPTPPSGPGSLAVPANPPDPKGPTLKAPTGPGGTTPPAGGSGAIASPTAEGEHSGWFRIDIVSPKAGKQKSREAFYKVICEGPKPPGSITTKVQIDQSKLKKAVRRPVKPN